MFRYRKANLQDCSAIAILHTESWQKHYRGMLRDDYLSNEVATDRWQVWHQRLSEISPQQKVVLAEAKDKLCGFVCLYLDRDQQWGALIDNLHVASQWQGQGLGKALIQTAAQQVQAHNPQSNIYLWVLEQNQTAIAFYERLGGRHQETVLDDLPGGGQGQLRRYVWTQPNQLLNL